VFDPYVKMANALPRVVLAPIFTLWLGLGIWSKVALGVTLVFFIVFFNVYQGVQEVSVTVRDNARMLGMNERQLMRHVYWPSALSWMFSSLHTSVGFAVVGAVVGEYLGSAAGLGYLIQQAEGVFDVAGVFAGMFVLSAFVILIGLGGAALARILRADRALLRRPLPRLQTAQSRREERHHPRRGRIRAGRGRHWAGTFPRKICAADERRRRPRRPCRPACPGSPARSCLAGAAASTRGRAPGSRGRGAVPEGSSRFPSDAAWRSRISAAGRAIRMPRVLRP